MGFRNGKSLKDYLVSAALPKRDNSGGFESCGKSTCQACDHIIRSNNFTTKGIREVFIKVDIITIIQKKLLYLLRCKICDDTP